MPKVVSGLKNKDDKTIERSLFAFIWKFSKRDQLVLVLVTAALFPVQYLTLELPKKIINDAISSGTDIVNLFGFQIAQVALLGILCAAFLLAVVGQGMLKLRLNTMKGVLAERMLRRFRYTLITRMFRFPQPYFQRTSQGELVSMVTAESETLGGMMGDAISLPIFQAGQMLTILAFLMVQSVWFGLAASALIPVQAWLIPKMQRQINLLNRERVQAVRQFATVIGESASGAVQLRKNGGLRYWKANVSNRLSRLFLIRFEIYQKKFFMKFVNNLITQLTPLMFYSFGGYLVIDGQLSLGALVAALAAQKDLASPWNELLTYYNQIQEASLRYITITERFAPDGMTKSSDLEGDAAPQPFLSGDVAMTNVTVRGADGATILKDITLNIPKGAMVGFGIESEETRKSFADLFTRELSPTSGKITIAGQELGSLSQAVIGSKIGHASSRPFVLQGTFGCNILIPLKITPQDLDGSVVAHKTKVNLRAESIRSGNSADPLDTIWVDPAAVGLTNQDEVHEWLLDLTEAIDTNGVLFTKGLEQKFHGKDFPDLSRKLVALRHEIAEELKNPIFEGAFFPFDKAKYNPALPIAGNLFFAIPNRVITQGELIERDNFPELLRKLNLEKEMLNLSRDVIEMLRRTFGDDGADHPLFQKLGLDPVIYEKCVKLLSKVGPTSTTGLADEDMALLLLVPFQISAEQIGPAFSNELKDRIVGLRQVAGELLKTGVDGLFTPLDPNEFSPGLPVLENILFGKISESAGPKAARLKDVVARGLRRSGLVRSMIDLIYEMPTDLNGGNLTSILAETLDLTRAAIKRPDILILEQVLASFDEADRNSALEKLRALLPDATIITLSHRFEDTSGFDAYYEISNSQILRADMPDLDPEDNAVAADLTRKLRLLENTSLFSGLDRKQLRLLAFGARWYTAPAGTLIFSIGDAPTDGAYLISDGEAELFRPGKDDEPDASIAMAEKGTLVGELGLIRNEPRALSMRANGDMTALRISAEAFLSVVENDAATAFKLLQVVAGYATRSSK